VAKKFTRIDDLIDKYEDQIDNIAVIQDDKSWTYGDIFDGAINVAAALQRHNVYLEKTIILLGNRVEAITTMMGISYIGGTFIPVPTDIKTARLADIIRDSGARSIITDEQHFPVTDNLDTDLSVLVFNVDEIPVHEDHLCQSVPAYPAAIMYTSGTTGDPKGVVCPHDKMMAATDAINTYMLHNSRDKIVTALPLNHGYGLYQVLTAFQVGATVILEKDFNFPTKLMEKIEKYQATGFAAVPTMIQMMIQSSDNWVEYLDSLDYITTAGAALPPTLFKTLLDSLPNADIIPMYGQTECVRALYYPRAWKKNDHNLNSCGKAIPFTTLYINGDPDEGGELIVENDHVMDGYWKNPEDTAKTFRDGKLHTGDVFKLVDGLYHYIGRQDDVVKIKGERTSPQMFENTLYKLDGVEQIGAFTIEDPLWGNRFVAYVVAPTLDRMALMRYCKQTMEGFMMPKDIVVVDELPKNGPGKINRKYLKETYLYLERNR